MLAGNFKRVSSADEFKGKDKRSFDGLRVLFGLEKKTASAWAKEKAKKERFV